MDPPSSASIDNRPLRLEYVLELSGGGAGGKILARPSPHATAYSRADLKRLRPELHPLDQAIVREAVAASVLGALSAAQVARLLPLLAQRKTHLRGQAGQLKLAEESLQATLRVEVAPTSGLRLTLGLRSEREPWIELWEGRLLAGPQAFFLRGTKAMAVEAPEPWELGAWARTPVRKLELGADAAERDALVRQLSRMGVPEEELKALAVRRSRPDEFVAHLGNALTGANEVSLELVLEANYGGERVALTGTQAQRVYLLPQDTPEIGLIQRDLVAEMEARRELKGLGFRFEKEKRCFVAHGEAALRAMDPHSHCFPEAWRVLRAQELPRFHRDLGMQARVRLTEADQGLLDVSVRVGSLDDGQQIQSLLEMRELLKWLHSGRSYLQLRDGTFVAPSRRFRRSLRVLDDLGAREDRVMVSPLCIGLLRLIGDEGALEEADAATRAWLAEVSGETQPQAVEPPPEVGGILRDYQRRGLEWLLMLHRHRLTGILADDMGLGKTLQALALLLAIRALEGPKPSLVVAPTSVVGVWRDEAGRFAPSLKVVLLRGPPQVRAQMTLDDADLVVSSYALLRRDAERLAKTAFRYVILDESQSAKNAASKNAKAIRQLRSDRRLALTGTPLENRSEELWATFDFLAPGFLGSLRHFRKRHALPIQRGDSEAVELLRARIRPLVLRRIKEDVVQELPPKMESVVRCDMLPAQRALYDHVAGELRESVAKRIAQAGLERARLDILAALTRLRQICCDPALLPVPEHVKTPPSAKLELFTELMREALASDRRVIVFSQFVRMQRRLIAVLRQLGVDPLWLHGGTKRRDHVVKGFQDPSGPPVILVSLKAGGTGLTLTRADTVMHYEPWWNPAVERQATDRAHRIGQQHQVNVYKLVCRDSIEERVLRLATRKEALARELLSTDDGTQPKQVTTEEIFALLAPQPAA